MTKRDDFSQATKLNLAIRAAHFCSNPDCLKLTAGPHSDPKKSLKTGHAAHIHAAALGGPRYNVSQTPEQRKEISNGLWLCRECGDIVDKDDSTHTAELLRQWKQDHEAMINEVRTRGYSDSLELLRSRRIEPALAKRIITLLEDRRALWESFDAEFPERVRLSLDHLRSRLAELRGEIQDGTPLDKVLFALIKTIHAFFCQVEQIDLTTLKCDGKDPVWNHFRNALATLRKAIGLHISNLSSVYGISLSSELQRMTPTEHERETL